MVLVALPCQGFNNSLYYFIGCLSVPQKGSWNVQEQELPMRKLVPKKEKEKLLCQLNLIRAKKFQIQH